jgi:gamma-glutamyltranspeptidase / glutathione hydrolase
VNDENHQFRHPRGVGHQQKKEAMSKTQTRNGTVVAPQPQAIPAGTQILRDGGNAVDAAIATAFAQGVVDPHMCGPGGFGTLHLFDAPRNEDVIVDFQGRAGSRAKPDEFTNDVVGQVRGHAERYEVRGFANQIGYRSVVVPGTVAGLFEAHRRYGRLPWSAVLEPAIRLAADGFPMSGELYRSWTSIPAPGHVDSLTRIKATAASAAIFTRSGELYRPGQKIVQSDLARTLESIATGGADAFYRGEIGDRIAEDFAENGGLITREDIAEYQPEVREPVKGTYRGNVVSSAPPPCSGVQVIEILNILEGFQLADMPHNAPAYVDIVSRAMQASFVDRARHLGDPRFVDVPVELFLSKDHAAEWRQLIEQGEHFEIPQLAFHESRDTTHVCTADGDGSVVSLTHTLGSASGVVTPGLGFTFNNCMYQFNPFPGRPNSIAPGKARITGLSPTIVFRDNAPWITVGAPGGTHIIGAVLHTILNIVDHDMSAVEAVSAPRFHCESDLLELESRIAYNIGDQLTELGHNIRATASGYDRSMALAHVIVADESGIQQGGADPRGGGGVGWLD